MTNLSLAEVLEEATQALQLDLDAEQRRRMLGYVGLLQRWNRTYNLTAVREPLAMMNQHVVDCLAVVPSLKGHLARIDSADRRARLIDVGSGAGLPGLILAVAMPELQVVCIDSVGKKASFIAQAAATLGLKNVVAHHARVEALSDPGFDVIASRALAALPTVVASTEHLLLPGGMWMAMKGVTPTAELGGLQDQYAFHVEQISVPGLDAARCVVWIKACQESERTLTSEESE